MPKLHYVVVYSDVGMRECIEALTKRIPTASPDSGQVALRLMERHMFGDPSNTIIRRDVYLFEQLMDIVSALPGVIPAEAQIWIAINGIPTVKVSQLKQNHHILVMSANDVVVHCGVRGQVIWTSRWKHWVSLVDSGHLRIVDYGVQTMASDILIRSKYLHPNPIREEALHKTPSRTE